MVLIIYYKKIKNSQPYHQQQQELSKFKANIIYEFKCPIGKCKFINNCVGHTTTCLSRWLTLQLSVYSSIRAHLHQYENLSTVIHNILVKNTNMICTFNSKMCLKIIEVTTIKKNFNSIN